MRVENPQSFRENVAETFKITFGITEDHLAKNIEISIFNYTLNESGKKKIVKKRCICYQQMFMFGENMFPVNIFFQETTFCLKKWNDHVVS